MDFLGSPANLATRTRLSNPRRLGAGSQCEDPLAADHRAHGHDARMVGGHIANQFRVGLIPVGILSIPSFAAVEDRTPQRIATQRRRRSFPATIPDGFDSEGLSMQQEPTPTRTCPACGSGGCPFRSRKKVAYVRSTHSVPAASL